MHSRRKSCVRLEWCPGANAATDVAIATIPIRNRIFDYSYSMNKGDEVVSSEVRRESGGALWSHHLMRGTKPSNNASQQFNERRALARSLKFASIDIRAVASE